MSNECFVGYDGQNQVLLGIHEKDPHIVFFVKFEGDEFEFDLHYLDCRKLLKHLTRMIYLVEEGQKLLENQDGKR
jgi:hypothetical protein